MYLIVTINCSHRLRYGSNQSENTVYVTTTTAQASLIHNTKNQTIAAAAAAAVVSVVDEVNVVILS